MRLKISHVSAISAVVVSIFAIGVSAALAQGVGISISQADKAEAAQALAAGHYGAELTPPQSEVTKGSSAFIRLGEARIRQRPAIPSIRCSLCLFRHGARSTWETLAA